MVMDLNVEIRIESIEQVFSMSRNRDQSSEVDYNKCVYPYTPKEFIKRLEKGKFGNDIAIVWGTTRHSPGDCKHPGYISDAMYVPEIIQNIHKLNKNINFKSFLDIDLTDEDKKNYNFILCGDGEVNYLAKKILDIYSSVNKIKYFQSDGPLYDVSQSRAKNNMHCVIQFFKNPWNKNEEKFIIHVGGIGPIGTIAGLKWLSFALDKKNYKSKLPHYPFFTIYGEEKDDYSEKFDGYKNHCKECSIVNEDKNVYYRGKISNVVSFYPIDRF